MNAPARSFTDAPAVREQVPLMIGLMGPSGSGKSFSALRLATGIQQVTGGEIYGIDTEARRLLHYADMFKFRHLQFDAPFGSLDYLAAIRHCVGQGAKVIVVDSMTHEHSAPGGYLQTQDAELDRMAGGDSAKRERVKMAAWILPARLRQQMITGILQLNANFIFCFRAKEKIKPNPGKQPIELGFMPIAGEELLFEMTVNMLLLPKSGGVPSWRSDHVGEKLMMKLPRQFEGIFQDPRPLDETIGQQLAAWARGGATTTAASSSPAADVGGEADSPSLAADPALIEGYETYVSGVLNEEGKSAREIADWWNGEGQKSQRAQIGPSDRMTALKAKVTAAIEARKVAA